MNPLLAFFLRLIIILLLYVFLGWIGYTIFIDLRKQAFHREQRIVPPLTIETVSDDVALSKQFSVPEVIIGRDPANVFPLEDSTISLRHLKLNFHHHQWWAEDLESTNGSYLNGVKIESPVVLTDGDKLRLGKVLLTININ
ncbi:MAG: FHA domain-containing protein [Chloroflexota bacterium]|nr:FHA domain-containing protein [Chloroflexota bacterium]